MTGTERRSEILDQVRRCVCRDRQATHGDAERNFHHIAHLWKWWLSARHHVDVPVDELDVAEMMVLFKSSRKAASPLHLDNWIDGAGYNVCGGGIVKAKEDETPAGKCHQCGSELGTNPRCAACAVFAGDEKMPCPKQQMVGISTARCSFIAEPNRQCVLGAGHSGQHVFAP